MLDIHLTIRTLQCFHLCCCWSFMFVEDMRLYSFCIKRLEIARVTRKAFFIQVLGVDVIFKKFNFCCLKFTFSTTQHIWGLSFRSVHQSSVTFQKVPVLCFIFTRLASRQSFFCFSVFVVVNVWHAIRTIYFCDFTEFKSLCCDFMWIITLFSK